ncbi:hypothetical protein GH714_004804 [Hevea brasiliensis]|uniref:Uncharacterized protein n=1 Tax=Hevea brasiliensis TaxID=3981 RepID=A0A6A6N9H0_HEVBR|nr:hypothetical protein GH714_004804 [Hevea brasiliensis]
MPRVLPVGVKCFPTMCVKLASMCPQYGLVLKHRQHETATKYQQGTPVCLLGGKDKSERGNEYVYIISGEELTRLVKDYIKFLLRGSKSVRLKRVMYKWKRFYQRLTEKKEVDKLWLERAIINTPTVYDSPTKQANFKVHVGIK